MARRRSLPARLKVRAAVGALVLALLAAQRLALWWGDRGHGHRVLATLRWVGPLILAAALALGALLIWRTVREHRVVAEMRGSIRAADATGRDGRGFEQIVADLLTAQGLVNAHTRGGAGDLGCDVLAFTPAGQRVVVQCKRYDPSRRVGSPEIQAFLGTCWTEHSADVAVLATTGQFTDPAIALARRGGVYLADRVAVSAAMAGHAPLIPAALYGGTL